MKAAIAFGLVLPVAGGLAAIAQPVAPDQPQARPNPPVNRYATIDGFFKLPAGRAMGSSSAVAGDSRGIRIGSVKDGIVTDFIPDTDPNPDAGTTSGGEGIWADGKGAVYSAQVEQKAIVKYVRK